jgi:hypothetical protein
MTLKSAQRGDNRTLPVMSRAGLLVSRPDPISITLALFLFGSSSLAYAQSSTLPTATRPDNQATSQAEVDQLRGEVERLRTEMEKLRLLVEAATKTREVPGSQRATEAGRTNPPPKQSGQQPASASPPTITPQSTATPDNPKVAVTSKAQGGDLSGAGNLLRTDRITIGGYGDFQFRQSSISERADGGGTPTFQFTRLVLGIAAVLAEKQNIVFNSEIEYEFGSREIDIEQAFVEWKMRPQFAFRGGIFVPAIGRFNVYHDSNLNLATIRPLINQFIVPTAYRDAGIGIRGRIKLPQNMKLTYEADLVNGMRGANADDEATPFSRILGQSSAAEPGLVAFQASNRRKAVVGRIAFSPINGLELGVSAYNGKFNNLGEPSQSVTILFLDGSYHRGPLAVNGEYGRSNIVGGIPRKSPMPPTIDPNDPESVTTLAEFVAERSPGQDGFYVEGAYNFNFTPRFFAERFDEGGFIAPVLRYEIARLDRTIPNFYLNRSRTTVGINIAPSSTVIFKLNYLFNHTFGPVPNVPAGIGGALFGVSPLPHLGYGRNGFAGSIAYVF